MGLSVNFVHHLLALKRAGVLDGARRVVEIGAQQLADSFLQATFELDEIYRLFGRPRADLGAPVGAENFIERAPYSRVFWTSLGLDYAAIDVDTREGVTYLDLNRDDVPFDLYRAFDLVINAGTTEHVSNQGNAFRIIHDLARTGGVMYHEVPAGGTIEHGFIAYQPVFFMRMAQQNEYEWLRFNLSAMQPAPVPEYLHEFNRRYVAHRFGGAFRSAAAAAGDAPAPPARRAGAAAAPALPDDRAPLSTCRETEPARGVEHAPSEPVIS